MWQKGQSGNPGGRRRDSETISVEKIARKRTQKAMNCLADMLDDPNAPHAAKVAAAAHLLDRGYGKPSQTVNANVRGTYWIADAPISPDEWAFEFAPKTEEQSIQ